MAMDFTQRMDAMIEFIADRNYGPPTTDRLSPETENARHELMGACLGLLFFHPDDAERIMEFLELHAVEENLLFDISELRNQFARWEDIG